jgi:hypothetical protein
LPDFFAIQISKRVEKIPNGRKIFQMAVKYTNIANSKALQNYPYWNFWYDNIQSGNPALDQAARANREQYIVVIVLFETIAPMSKCTLDPIMGCSY